MEYILYYDGYVRGYSFYERSASFPESNAALMTELEHICKNISAPETVAGNTTAVRYTPFEKNHIFSFIFRQVTGDTQQQRPINFVVNFLMNTKDADDYFKDFSVSSLIRLQKKAHELLLYHGQNVVPPSDRQHSLPMHRKIELKALLTAAAYAKETPLHDQAIYVSEYPSLETIASVLLLLPPKLRKQVSFHTGIQNASEAIGIALSFTDTAVARDFSKNRLSGGLKSVTRHLYYFYEGSSQEPIQPDIEGFRQYDAVYKVLQTPPCPELSEPIIKKIDTWKQLDDLAELWEDPVAYFLENIPEETLSSYAYSGKLTAKTLELFLCSRHLKKYRKLKKELERAEANSFTRKAPGREDIFPSVEPDISTKHTVPTALGIDPHGYADADRKRPEPFDPLQPAGNHLPNSSTEVQPEVQPERKQHKQRAPKPIPQNKDSQPLHEGLRQRLPEILHSAICLVVLAALLISGICTLTDFISLSKVTEENLVIFVVDINGMHMLLRLLALLCITAAFSVVSMLTLSYHAKRKDRRQNSSQNKQQ